MWLLTRCKGWSECKTSTTIGREEGQGREEERRAGRKGEDEDAFTYCTGYLLYASTTINYFGVWYLRRWSEGGAYWPKEGEGGGCRGNPVF